MVGLSCDLVVVGAGILGSIVAAEARRRSPAAKILLLDRGTVGCGTTRHSAALSTPTGATAATFRRPVLVTPTLGGIPGPPGGVIVTCPGLAAPPITVSAWFITSPFASKKFPCRATPRGP